MKTIFGEIHFSEHDRIGFEVAEVHEVYAIVESAPKALQYGLVEQIHNLTGWDYVTPSEYEGEVIRHD